MFGSSAILDRRSVIAFEMSSIRCCNKPTFVDGTRRSTSNSRLEGSFLFSTIKKCSESKCDIARDKSESAANLFRWLLGYVYSQPKDYDYCLWELWYSVFNTTHLKLSGVENGVAQLSQPQSKPVDCFPSEARLI